MNQEFSKNYKIVFIVLLAIIALSSSYSSLSRSKGMMTVTGSADISVKPEEVSMIVTRATVAASADVAVAQGEAAMSKLITVVNNITGNSAEIKKSFYQVTPQTDGSYLMANAISVKTKKVTLTENLIKTLYANGASTVSNIAFSPINDGSVEKEARDLALKDAKSKADGIAKSMGRRVGKVVSISDDSNEMNSNIGDGAYVGSNIGTINMTRKISVAYEIN